MFDYEVLRLIWWALLGVLLVAFAITDGFGRQSLDSCGIAHPEKK